MTSRVRQVDSLQQCPFGVVAFVFASRSTLQGLSGEKRAESRRKKQKKRPEPEISLLLSRMMSKKSEEGKFNVMKGCLMLFYVVAHVSVAMTSKNNSQCVYKGEKKIQYRSECTNFAVLKKKMAALV